MQQQTISRRFFKQAIAPSIPDFLADGLYLSITCAEDVPFINPEEAAASECEQSVR